ncbi:MAG: peptidoglycan-binding protein [Phormidesmis sp. CAN_BIN36]|nr:peptidoglycan-binding protein [Phormidesmis sp. CAN_BIN36]
MSRQSQWLFEVPPIARGRLNTSYTYPELINEWESQKELSLSQTAVTALRIEDQRAALAVLTTLVAASTASTVDNALKIVKLICLFAEIPWRLGYIILEHEGGVRLFQDADGVMQTTRAAREHVIPTIPRVIKLVLLGLPLTDSTRDSILTKRLHQEFSKRLAVQIATGIQELKNNLDACSSYVALAYVGYNAGTGNARYIAMLGRAKTRPSGITVFQWEEMCRFGSSLLHQRPGNGSGFVEVQQGRWQCDKNLNSNRGGWFRAFSVRDRQSQLALIAYQYLRSINACILRQPPSEACAANNHTARLSGSGTLKCENTRAGALDKLYSPSRFLNSDYYNAARMELAAIADDNLPLKIYNGHLVKVALVSTQPGVIPPLTQVEPLALTIVRNWVFSQFLGWGAKRDAIANRLLGFTNMTPDDFSFARAVTRWQISRGLPATGVINSATWAAMKILLG